MIKDLKKDKSFKYLFLSTLLVVLASCNPLGELTVTDDDFCLGARQSCKILKENEIDLIDDDSTTTGFGGGTYNGTIYQNGVLTLNTTTNNAELDKSWTPKWDNIVGYWKMNNDWKNSKGSAADGVATNAAFTSNSKVGTHAGSFDGTARNVNIASVEIAATSTLSSWVKFNSLGSKQRIFGGCEDPNSPCNGIDYKSLNISVESNNNLSLAIGNDFGDRRLTETTLSSPFSNGIWFHIAAVLDVVNNDIKLFINGTLMDSSLNAVGSGTVPSFFLQAAFGALYINQNNSYVSRLNGDIDELAIWNTQLSSDEIALIYSRQAAKYAGEMKSRIIDANDTSSSWTNLDWITTLPFGKELPDGGGTANSESTLDYNLIASTPSPYEGLMDGIVGLWHLNGNEGTIADDTIIEDSSGNGNDGLAKDSDGANTIAYTKGKLNQGIQFAGVDDHIQLPIYPSNSTKTLSLWIKFNSIGVVQQLVGSHDSNNHRFYLGLDENSNIFAGLGDDYMGSDKNLVPSGVKTNQWHHWTLVGDGATASVYIDGKYKGGFINYSFTGTSTNLLALGARILGGSASTPIKGAIDEVAIWNRSLSAEEVLDLYRRGANRIKYQVRSCSNSSCSDQETREGNGWKGPGGNFQTYFSELQNNTSISSNCLTPQKCFSSELSLDGDVKIDSPSVNFSDFGADGINVDKNQYFQYRVIMESDDESGACTGGTTCMPELKSIEVGLQ